MANNQITPFQLTDQFTMDNFNQRINETNIALQNKAPAGYGLGEVCKIVDNFESVTVNGWYAAIGDSSPDTGGWWIGLYATLGSMGSILAFKDGYIAQKKKYYNTWGPWEWVNPPMLLGVEYRTTERYQGKPVYTRLVDFGSFPNSTQKDVAIPEKGFSAYNVCIDFTKSVVTYPNDPRTSILPFKNGITEISVNNACVRVTTSSDLSSASGYICVKYTKSTD